MSGPTRIGERFCEEGIVPTIPLEWQIAATGDFNGDSQSDIVWQNNQTGARAIWLMNGTTAVGERFLPTIPLQWQIAGAGDFNGDGDSDVIWQNSSTGQRAIWIMDQTTPVGDRFLPVIPIEWDMRNH